MQIQIRKWDGQGDFEDPNTGELLITTPQAIYGMVGGRAITGVGGVAVGTEAIQFNLQDGGAIWFVTAGGTPRILIRTPPKP
jgi:hypothetical protein